MTLLSLTVSLFGCRGDASRADTEAGDAAPVVVARAAPSVDASSAAGISGGADLPPADRRSQCNRLIAIISRSVKRLQQEGDDEVDQTANLRRMADALAQTEHEVRGETYDFEALEALRLEYARLVAEAAREARTMATAARANDMTEMVEAEGKLDRTLAREKPFMRRLTQFCR